MYDCIDNTKLYHCKTMMFQIKVFNNGNARHQTKANIKASVKPLQFKARQEQPYELSFSPGQSSISIELTIIYFNFAFTRTS